VLILLPPSEGKAAPRRGRSIDLDRLTLPELAPVRERVLASLTELCGSDQNGGSAAKALGLGPGLRDDVIRNAALRAAPTAPAGAIYAGVLYDSLDLASLDGRARRAAARSLLIFSGLWGVLRVGDRIPSYRCSIGARLPGLGPLAAYWRANLAGPVADLAGRGLVLDLRSSSYAAAWSAPPSVAVRTVTVRVLQERIAAGVPTRSVVSHFNKATKGRLVRDLLAAGANPRNPTALVGALKELGYRVEEPAPGAIDVVVTEV
jgi:cytoplasmic iron level regulating protein YaaA (DUF328/UPF0246 family)